MEAVNGCVAVPLRGRPWQGVGQGPAGLRPSRRRLRASDGAGLSVIVWPGSRPTGFLLVHGLSSNARLWDGVSEHLAATGCPVAAVDQRSHGRSDRVDGPFDFATLADDLAAVIEGVFPPETAVIVAGQSLGGNVVVELARRHPRKVAGAAFIDGGFITLSDLFPDWETALAELTPPSFEGLTPDVLERRLREGHPDWLESGIRGQMANFATDPDGTLRPHLAREHHMMLLRQMWEHHPAEDAPFVECPALIVAAHDPSPAGKAKRRSVDRFARRLPRGRLILVEADHDLHAQYPRRTAGWLEELAGEASR